MLNSRLFRLIYEKRLCIAVPRSFHHEFNQPERTKNNAKEQSKENQADGSTVTCTVLQKYKVFHDKDAAEIFDVEEERQRYNIPVASEETMDDPYSNLNLKRGINGVFEIEDLVDVLRKEAAEDIFVCAVPKELKYVDYLVICSGRSYRHMLATAEYVRRMYKIKRQTGDILPKIEGEKSRDWMALDLGNLALHIFSSKVREEYDLESLWAIGAKYDNISNKPLDSLTQLLEKNTTVFLGGKP